MMIFASKNKAKWGARGRIWVYIVALESLSEDEFSLYRLSMTFSGRFLFFSFLLFLAETANHQVWYLSAFYTGHKY